jgi:hypothetical protein
MCGPTYRIPKKRGVASNDALGVKRPKRAGYQSHAGQRSDVTDPALRFKNIVEAK